MTFLLIGKGKVRVKLTQRFRSKGNIEVRRRHVHKSTLILSTEGRVSERSKMKWQRKKEKRRTNFSRECKM